MTARPDVTDLAAAERNDLADFVAGLTPQQWNVPSLCTDWSVRDVVAHHISYDLLSWPRTIVRLVRGGLTTGGPNALGVAALSNRTTDDLIGLLRRYATPRGLTSLAGGRIALTDGLIHHQDIRRPLGMPREVPEARLHVALSGIRGRGPTPGRGNARDLRLVATDIDWSDGTGPEVAGPGEALLLAVQGRSAALPELSGAGLPTLVARVRTG